MAKKYPSIAHKFVERLVNTYSIPLIPQETCNEYVSSLLGANLKEDQWDKVLELIKSREDRFPSISKIFEAIKEVRQLSAGIVRNRAVQLFELDGYQKARYFTMPDIPALPPGAVNARIRILDSVEDPNYRCSPEEARAAFRKGWIESGADHAKCDAMFEEIDRQARTQLADYDDRLTNDEL